MSLTPKPRPHRGRTLFLAVLLILSLATIALGIWLLVDQRQQIAAGVAPGGRCGRALTPAPDFELTASDGQVIRLADLRGKVVLLNFWATWCPPCKAEMPDLNALQRKYGADRDFVVLGVNDEESAADVIAFAQREGIAFPLLLDPRWPRDREALRRALSADLDDHRSRRQHPRHLARPDRPRGHAGPAAKGLVNNRYDEEVMTAITPASGSGRPSGTSNPTAHPIRSTSRRPRGASWRTTTARPTWMISSATTWRSTRRGRRMRLAGWRIAAASACSNSCRTAPLKWCATKYGG